MVNYLKAVGQNPNIIYRERKDGHGIKAKEVSKEYDLLIIVDSSSSEKEETNKIALHTDIVILDHHNTDENSESLNAILVNPNQKNCSYTNKDLSGCGVVFRFIEVLDYHYKKVNLKHYVDLFGISLLSDVMRMDVLENRYFLQEALKNIHNKGLLALINASKLEKDNLDSQALAFSIIPVINTTARNNQIKKAFSLFFEDDYFRALKKAEWLIQENKDRKKYVKDMTEEVEVIVENAKFAYVVTDEGFGEYNGLIATQISNNLHKPSFVLRGDNGIYKGSARTYGDFQLQSFVKESGLVELAAGHESAFGFQIKEENWNTFRQYVEDNIDESLFEPVIEYDLEIDEENFDWDLMDEISEFNKMWGNGSPPVTVKLNKIFVEDRQVFPPKNPSHVKIVTDKFDLLAFNDPDFANEVESWDNVEAVGQVSINEWNGQRKMQLIIDDYRKND